MALQKNRQFNNTEVAYWKISGINVTYTGNMAQIFVIGFASLEDRTKGLENKIAFENYFVTGEDFKKYFDLGILDVLGSNPLTAAYKYLKEKLNIFADSVDV